MMDIGLLILYIVFGFIAFCLLLATGVMYVFFRRRKLTFTNFLNEAGRWEKEEWKPNQIDKMFEYDGETYEFDIRLCTRDSLNRPIGHYYKGNPKQQRFFPVEMGNKHITIGTSDVTGKDFVALLKSKVLRDIFNDDEYMKWMIIILITNVVVGVILGILIYFNNPEVILKIDDANTQLIVEAVKLALQR